MVPPKIGVCGELVGGSLAAMLALTECHGDSEGISAAAIGNAIVDWTALMSAVEDQESEAAHKGQSFSGELLAIRGDYFPKVENYHDPFASPLLFFRTPSSDLPLEHTFRQSSESDPDSEDALPEHIKKRRSLRKYPPTGSGLILPHMRVDVGKENVLNDQGIELVDLMRRSSARWEAERPILLGKGYPQPSFEVVEREGFGLWDEKKLPDIGNWLGEVLRKS